MAGHGRGRDRNDTGEERGLKGSSIDALRDLLQDLKGLIGKSRYLC